MAVLTEMLLKRGAEADIYLEEWRGRKVILKRRIAKSYRHPEVDKALRASRTAREARILGDAKRAGVPVPTLYRADSERSEITMEYLEGRRLRDHVDGLAPALQQDLAVQAGQMIAILHRSDIVHGDVTTSNLIESGGRVHLIDFGLSNYSKLVEDRGVDLLLAKRSLRSTHGRGFAKLFANFLSGYSGSFGRDWKIAVEKMNEIERRGRYNERAG